MDEQPSKAEVNAMLDRLLRESEADTQAGRTAEAAEKLETLAAMGVRDPALYWNLATSRAVLGQFDRAVSAWEAYRRAAPDDWSVRPRIIQMCHALGDTERIDRERAELLALFRSGAHPDLSAERCYCREQFRIEEVTVLANEIFEPGGARRVFYEFLIARLDRTPIGRYSLGSYDSTTQLRRELGKLGPEERIYHLDWYDARGHTTFGFFPRLPSYDETRAQVVAALTGALPPVSSITTSPETGRADIYLSQDAPAETREICLPHELGVAAFEGGSPQPPHPPPPAAPPPSPAQPDATRVATGGRAPAERAGGGGPLDALKEWLGRLVGRGGRPS
ncbi:MAG TPA: hypothetical protein VFR81_23025 [Longimicrobium sp.]|nr:hypothetical protein [Longimicrobium sp.]